MIITLLRIGLLILSMTGFMCILNQRFNLRIEYTPAIVCAGISLIMFIAGVLNIFNIAVLVAVILGIVFFVMYAKKTFYKQTRNLIVILIWLMVLAFFAILLRGAHFLHYDNFSHWATVVKNMLINNRMPNFEDSFIIMFQAYPLGSSLFLYYVCKVIGTTDACYIFAQIMLSVSFLTSLLVFARRKYVIILAVPLYWAYSLVANITIYDLLVDTIMPLAGIAVFCIICFEETDDEQIKRNLIVTTLLYVFLVNVKNSGIFFVIICWIYWLIVNRKRIKENKKLIANFALWNVLIPVATMILWKAHVNLVFDTGAVSKHAMSMQNYSVGLAEKSLNDINMIWNLIIKHSFSLSTLSFQIMLTVSLLLIIVILQRIIKRKENEANIIAILSPMFAVWSIWFFYIVSLFGMYVFSMPLSEAITLDSIDRYLTTVIIFILGISLAIILKYWNTNNIFLSLLVICIFIFPLYQVKADLPQLFTKQDYGSTIRYKLQNIISQNDVQSGKSYCIYSSDGPIGYLNFLARYELWTDNIMFVSRDDIKNNEDKIPDADYFILWDEDQEVKQYLAESGLKKYAVKDKAIVSLK